MMTQNDFFNLLENTAAERPKRSEFVNGELEWVTHEREVMQAAVNKERRKANLPALPMDMIIRVEQTAMGHCDYTRKFALYCFQLAHDAYEPRKAEAPEFVTAELKCDNCNTKFEVKAFEHEDDVETEQTHSCTICGSVLCPACRRFHDMSCTEERDEEELLDDDPLAEDPEEGDRA